MLVTFEQVIGCEDFERDVLVDVVPRRGDLVELPHACDDDGEITEPPIVGTVSHVLWRPPRVRVAGTAELVPVVVLFTRPVAGSRA